MKSLWSKSRRPSGRNNPLSVSWHPAPLGKDLSDQLGIISEGTETDTPAAVAPQKDPERLINESKNADQKIRPSFNQMKSLRPELRRPSFSNNPLSGSWHPAPRGRDPSDQKETERKEIKKRPSLIRQASSILRKQQRPSTQGLTHRSILDPVEMEQIQIIDDDKVHPSRKKLHWWHAVFFFSIICYLSRCHH